MEQSHEKLREFKKVVDSSSVSVQLFETVMGYLFPTFS